MVNSNISYYEGKRVLITGNTGFKGSWLCKVLDYNNAQVTGFALVPPTSPALFELGEVECDINSINGDICNLHDLKKVFQENQPEIVIHMAAQPLVRESYLDPAYTYNVNVMGTVNVLECIRQTPSVKSFVNVTTDKVYLNREWSWGYREDEELNGFDPYSNSKSCSELVTSCYRNSFFSDGRVAISTVRAGNVIGGGDFAKDRIIPDCIRAAREGRDIVVRNPYSIRPYQHVLEPLTAYLMIAEKQLENPALAGSYNIGPNETDCITTGELVTLFCQKWNDATGDSITWRSEHDGGPHEANFLKLDCSKVKTAFGWKPKWNIEKAIEKIVEWELIYRDGGNVKKCMDRQIREYLEA